MFKRIFNRKQENILSASFVLMVAYASSMVLGILRERVLVSHFYYCCKDALDAYYAAFRLPDMVFQLVVIGALSASFIPVFGEYLVKDEKMAYKISSSLINILFVFYFVLAGFIFLFSKELSILITGQFTPSQIETMSGLTKLMIVAQGFFLISNFLTAIIQTHQRFVIPAIAPLVYNLGIILSVVFLNGFLGIWSAAIGVLVGAFFHLAVQIPLALNLGFNYKFIFDFSLPGVKEIFSLMFPRTLGLAVYQVQATVSLFLATSLTSGSLTIFYLAQKLMDLPVRLFGTSIGQASLPSLTYKKTQNEIEKFRQTLISCLNQILFLSFPAMVAILVLRIPLVRIAYGAKTFPWQATVMTGRVVALISLAVFSQSACELLVRAFYALHDTKNPFLIGTISVVINIALGFLSVFKFSWGILGLAASISISSFLQMMLLLVYLQKKIGKIFSFDIFEEWLKMIFSTMLAAFSFWVIMKVFDLFVLDTTKTINLLLLTLFSICGGLSIYLISSFKLKIKEIYDFLEIIKKIGKIKKIILDSSEVIS